MEDIKEEIIFKYIKFLEDKIIYSSNLHNNEELRLEFIAFLFNGKENSFNEKDIKE